MHQVAEQHTADAAVISIIAESLANAVVVATISITFVVVVVTVVVLVLELRHIVDTVASMARSTGIHFILLSLPPLAV